MKYMLLMNVVGRAPYSISTWPKQDVEAHLAFLRQFNRTLRETGEFVGVEGLTHPERAKLIRAGKDSVPITDGVFPETKEFLAGFWIVDVDSAERAYRIAAQISAAPGKGGVPLNMAVELRQVMSAPPVDQ
jgi:hypothetical protein